MKTRLKIALFFITCLQAGFSFASIYYWYPGNYKHIRASSPQQACQSFHDIKGYPDSWFNKTSYSESLSRWYCYISSTLDGIVLDQVHITRSGDSCSPDTEELPDGTCSIPSKPECPSSGTDLKKTITESDFEKLFSGSREQVDSGTGFSTVIVTDGPSPYQHCKIHFNFVLCYTPVINGQKGDRLCDITDGTYSGEEFVSTPDTESPVPEYNDQNTPEQNENCGLINGEQVCIPKDETCTNQALCDAAPQCKYVKGAYTCFDPNTQKEIPADSPDHPNNGGNADGDTSNDPISPDSPPPSDNPHSKDGSATNKKIDDLIGNNQTGFKSLGKKLDQTNNLLSDFAKVDQDAIEQGKS
ncbi:hypothetical protein ACRQ5F_24120, partial [Endozoicomonas acroporae]